jgi:hypothetical protein
MPRRAAPKPAAYPGDPRGKRQWQTAVDLAFAALVSNSLSAYGLSEGYTPLPWRRCVYLIRGGLSRGIKPSASAFEIIVGELSLGAPAPGERGD